MLDEAELRSESRPLPRTRDGVLALVKQVLSLSEVQELAITPLGVSVTRRVAPGTEVIPGPELMDIPLSQVLGMVEVETVQSGAANPYLDVTAAFLGLRRKGVEPIAVVVFDLEEFAAFLGLERNDLGTPPSIFGVEILLVEAQADDYTGKVVVLGGTSRYLSDARYGMLFDVGG